MQDEVFLLNLGLNMCVLILVRSVKPDCSEPNQGLQCQIIMWDLHSSEILHSLEWYLLSGVSAWPISPVPSLMVKKSKRENIAWLKLPDTFIFYGTLSFAWFFKDAWRFRSRFCLRFQAKKHLMLDLLLSITGHHRSSNLSRYTPLNRSSSKAVTGKWLPNN
jgi:hypothetical protein